MNNPIQHTTEDKLQESAGSEFSFIKKLKIGGTGSMKMIHIEGLEFIDEFAPTSKSHHHLSFELRPNSLIGRTYGNGSKTFTIKKEALLGVHFETYNLRILTKTGIVIRHEALAQIRLENKSFKLYIPRAAYKPIRIFFNKDWLKHKTKFTVSSSEPELNSTALIAEIITRMIGT